MINLNQYFHKLKVRDKDKLLKYVHKDLKVAKSKGIFKKFQK